MLRNAGKIFAMTALVLGATVAVANAACEGRKTTDTALGAGAGGIAGAVITHGSPVGLIGGAVVGGLAGHTIASDHCYTHHYYRHGYYDRYHHWHSYS